MCTKPKGSENTKKSFMSHAYTHPVLIMKLYHPVE